MEKTIEVSGIIDDGKFFSGGFSIEIESGYISTVKRCTPTGKWKDCIASPGLIQSHVHLGQTLFRGMAEGKTLIPWLENRIWPFEASHSPDTLAVSVIQSLKELYSSGCTGLLDMGVLRDSEVTVDILRRAGARALAGNALMDKGPEWITEELSWLSRETERVISSCGDNVSYVYAPRFALSCSDGIWEWLADLPEGMKRTTHAAESPDEIDDPQISQSGGNIKFLHARGFTGVDTLLAHCVYLQEGETEILRSSGTTAVHCPWANLRLGSGIADIPAMLSAGVNIAVGSDGAPCNNRLDLAGDLRLAMGLASVRGTPSAPATRFWFKTVTSNAALSLGWSDTGRLSEGYAADITLLEPSEEENDELELSEDPVRYILELAWPERVVFAAIAGRTVFENGEFPTLPPLPMPLSAARREILEKATALPGKLLSK